MVQIQQLTILEERKGNSMINNNWLEHPALVNMDKRKKIVIMNLMKETSGKGLTECMPAIMKANNTLRSQGIEFTAQENVVIMELMTSNMNAQEQKQFQMLQQMMSRMKK